METEVQRVLSKPFIQGEPIKYLKETVWFLIYCLNYKDSTMSI